MMLLLDCGLRANYAYQVTKQLLACGFLCCVMFEENACSIYYESEDQDEMEFVDILYLEIKKLICVTQRELSFS